MFNTFICITLEYAKITQKNILLLSFRRINSHKNTLTKKFANLIPHENNYLYSNMIFWETSQKSD